MVLRSMLLGVGAILSVAAIVAACGSSGSTTSGTCLPGATSACACAAGMQGFQTCQADGKSLGMCQCGSGTGNGGSTSTSSTSSSATGTGGGTSCSCNPSSELYCGVAACADAGTGDAGDAGSCTNVVTFAGKAVGTDFDGGASAMDWGSDWTYKALNGLPAGNQACQDMGADHVCDYDDVVLAASKGELSTLATTDTAWLYRVNAVTISSTSPDIEVLGSPATMGTTYQVGLASRCANWTYQTDHLNDGEFVSFQNGVNSPQFHLDDNPGAIQATPKDIPCGHNLMPRAVLCCFPKCL